MQRVAFALIALALVARATHAQELYDPDVRARDLFAVVLPELRAAQAADADGEPFEPLSAARLEWLYDRLLVFRADHFERWPIEQDFPEVMESIHAYAAAHGYDLEPLAWSDWNRSLLFEERGRTGEMRALLERNLRRYPEDVPQRPLLLYALGHYERSCAHWEAALELLDEAEGSIASLATEGAEEAELARVLIDLERCAVSIELGLFEDAIPAVVRARASAEALGDPVLWADGLVESLNLAVALDDHTRIDALAAAAHAHPLFAELGARERARIALRIAIAKAESERQNGREPHAARPLLEEVLTGDALPDRDARLARVWLVDLLIETGDLPEAAAQLARLAEAEPSGEEARACVGDLPDRLEIARIVLAGRLALARGDDPEALRAELERTEAAFDSMLRHDEATRISERGLAVLFARMRMQMTESLVALTLRVHPLDGPARALAHMARAQALGSLARTLGAGPVNEVDVRAELVPAGGGLLVYLPGAKRTIVFAIDRDHTRLFELAPIYRLDPRRRELVRAIGHAVLAAEGGDSRGDVDAQARTRVDELATEFAADLLPAQLAEHIAAWTDVVVVGLDSLGYVPFELLPWSAGERLGVAKAVAYLPSLPVGLWLARHRRTATAGRVTVFAAPDAPDGAAGRFPRLASAAFGPEEERGLLRAVPSAKRVFAGRAAALDELLALDARDDLALQFVAHGVRAPRSDRPPGLLFFPPATHGGRDAGTLTPELAETLGLPPLVVVTACGAWQGPQRRGDDGRAHLAGSFLIAGARALVISHAPIDYRSSLHTMEAFYEGLFERGDTPARALARARAAAAPGDLTPFLVHAVGLANDPLPADVLRAGSAQDLLGSGWLAAVPLALVALLVVRRWRRHA